MNTISQQRKPRWVKLLIAAIAMSLGVPVILSFVFFHHYQFWQLIALLIGCAWLLVCGFFTTFNPLPIARYLARPGMYDLMLRDQHPAATRWYFRIAGAVMMLISLLLGSVFFVLRNAPIPRTPVQARP